MNAVCNADALIEADKICAAAEEHVLAVVDDLVDAGMQIGAGTAAEIGAALDEMDLETALGKSACSGKAGDAGADDGDGSAAVSN